MAKVTEKNTVFAVAEEVSYAADPGPATTASDCISILKGSDFADNYEELPSDDVVVDTFSESPSSRGAETSSLNLPIPLVGGGRSSGVITAPEHGVLYKCAHGEDHILTANDTVGGTPTTSTCDVTTPANFKVGDGIIIDNTTDGLHVAFITDVSGSTITWWPACTTAPSSGDTIYTGANYRLADLTGAEAELPSFFMDKWLNNDDHYEYFGQKITSLTWNYAAGQHINPAVVTDGQKVSVTASDPHGFTGITYDVDQRARMVAVNMQVILDSGSPATYDASSVNLVLTNTLYDPRVVTTSGRGELTRTQRSVRGTMELFYESLQPFSDYKSETTFKMLLMAHGGGTDNTPVLGNTFAQYLQKVKFTNVKESVDNGIYKYTIDFQAQKVNGGDELFSSFL